MDGVIRDPSMLGYHYVKLARSLCGVGRDVRPGILIANMQVEVSECNLCRRNQSMLDH
jgi:hypothetical protein